MVLHHASSHYSTNSVAMPARGHVGDCRGEDRLTAEPRVDSSVAVIHDGFVCSPVVPAYACPAAGRLPGQRIWGSQELCSLGDTCVVCP
jgi:hypothetical protein